MAEPKERAEEYDDAMVAMLELVWGEGFLSPGGPGAVRAIVEGLDLAQKTVLDIGCGIGGVDVLLAREYGCRVIGFDIEAPLIERARTRAEQAGLADRIEFRLVEPGPFALPDASVDVVFGKDSWGQIGNKQAFFEEVYRVLRPGGELAAADWFCAPGPYSADMLYFFEMEGLTYNLATLEAYGEILRACGFIDVSLIDVSGAYRAQAHDEYPRMRGPLRGSMLKALGPEKQAHFVEDWRAMTVVLDKRELRTGRFRGRKPA